LACATLYGDVFTLSAGRTIMGDDLTELFLHWARFINESLAAGELPLWNPYLFSGLPFVANPQPALFYPPTWLILLLPAPQAFGLSALLHVWIAGVGMYAWLRAERASQAGALLAGLVFAFSGYFFVRVRVGHLGVVTTGVWLPLILWLYRVAEARRSWAWAIVGGLPVGLSILAGHTASFIYVGLALGAYAGARAGAGWARAGRPREPLLALARAGVMGLVGLGLAAVQLAPMARLALRSARQAAPSYDFAARFSWPPGYLLTLLVPNFFGEPMYTGYWGGGNYDEFILYVGVLPLLLALLGLRRRHRLTRFLGGLALAGLLLAMGEYGVLHRLAYRLLPFFRLMRAPARAGYLFTFAAAALAGLALTHLAALSPAARERWLAPLSPRLVGAVLGAGVVLVSAGFSAFALGREANPAAGRIWHQANQVAQFLLLFALAAGLLRAWRRRDGRALPILVLGLALLDLGSFGAPLIAPRDVSQSAYWSTVAQVIPDPRESRVLPWGLNDEQQNGGMPYGLRNVFGYDPLILGRYERFVSSLPDPRARTYDLLNAGYLITMAPQEYPPDAPESPRLVEEREGVWIYRRPNALPRAWVAPQIEVRDEGQILDRIHAPDFDPRETALVEQPIACDAGTGEGTVTIERYQNNHIVAHVSGGGGLLVFSEVDYPGWRAHVDGRRVDVVRADYLLRAVCVPAGDHRVSLVYDPPLLKWGAGVTALTLLIVAGAALGLVRERRRAS
jgi:hypothetical protein